MPGEEVLLDLNVLAGDSDYFALGAYDLAPGQDLLLYSTDHDGSERYTMRVRDLRTGDGPRRRDPRHHLRHRVGGRRDRSSTCGMDEAMRPHQVWRHEVGTPTDDDVLVYEDPDERFFVGGRPQPHRGVGPHLIGLEGHQRGAPDPCRRPDRGPRWSCSPASRASSTTSPTRPRPTSDRFVILTNADGAVNFKLVDRARSPTPVASTGWSSSPTAPT